MKLEPLGEDQVQSTIRHAVQDAVDYVESDIADDRLKAQRYYDGEVDIGHEEGRSKVVSTKCRDTVNAIKPALMRAFLTTDKPVEFVPRTPEDVQAAEQATDYINWKFNECNGYQVVHDAIHDAIVKKTGIVKVYWSDETDVEIDEYTGLTDEQYQLVINDPDVEILEHEEEILAETADPMTGQMMVQRSHDLKVSYEKPAGDIKIETIPPEDFFIDAESSSIDDAYVCGHRNGDVRVGDLVAMGYDFDEVIEYAGSEESAIQEEAELERQGYYESNADENSIDPTMRKILVTEAYMKMDVEGTGVPKCYWFLLLGTQYHILDYQLADQIPFAVFETQREPHTFFGKSVVEQIMDDQDVATSMLRGMLDNIALTNTPQVTVLEGQVNMEDLLNFEVGAVRRVKNMDAIRYDAVPFFAGDTIAAMQYHDEIVESKTGISRASMGLDPDALQNTSATAASAMERAATGRVELYARNLAEGGMRQLFKKMLKLTRQNTDQETMMRLNGQFVPVDPRSWSADMDVTVNVGLGTGGDLERAAVLRETLQTQMQIWSNYGPGNGLVTMTQIRNTLADILKLGGVHNADRHYMPMDPQTEKMLIQQAQQAQEAAAQQSDPNQAYLQAEMMKTQAKTQVDMQKAQLDAQKAAAEHQRKLLEMAKSDDLDRDQMAQDLLVKAAEIVGQYGTTVDVERIRSEQQKPREF